MHRNTADTCHVHAQVGHVMRPLLQFWYHEDVRSSAIATMPAMVNCAKKYATANNMDNAVVKQVTHDA